MKIAMELFMRMHRFRQLRIAERLHTLPNNGHIVLGILIANQNQNKEGYISCTELAKQMNVTTPAISRTLRHLRESGLINTEPDPKDRRGTIISITELGRKTMETNCQRLEALMERAAADLSQDDLIRFFNTFDTLYSGVLNELEKESNDINKL